MGPQRASKINRRSKMSRKEGKDSNCLSVHDVQGQQNDKQSVGVSNQSISHNENEDFEEFSKETITTNEANDETQRLKLAL